MARRVSWALCVAVVCSRGLSQAGRDVVLRFLDSQTGFAITPDTVLLNGARAELKPAGSAGAFTLGLVSPPARLDVAKRGYAPLRADVDASAASRPAELVLDPLEPPREFSRGFLKEFLRDDLALVVGFVSDDTTGQALPGVEVLFTHASEKVAPTQTQANGSFVLSVPWKIAERKGTDDPTILSFNKIGYQTLERQYVQLYPAHAAKYRIRLTKGEGRKTIDERQFRKGFDRSLPREDEHKIPPAPQAARPVLVLPSIRVGTDCAGRRCTGPTRTSTLETYTKNVLPAEWIPSWHPNALKAGSIAVRTFGAYFVNHPIATTYDICDNEACQVLGDETFDSTDDAVDDTRSTVLMTALRDIAASEYSEEANATRCGDGRTAECIDDPLCASTTAHGHGRGMCQNGSQRWAKGNRTQTPKDYHWILSHYYPNFTTYTP